MTTFQLLCILLCTIEMTTLITSNLIVQTLPHVVRVNETIRLCLTVNISDLNMAGDNAELQINISHSRYVYLVGDLPVLVCDGACHPAICDGACHSATCNGTCHPATYNGACHPANVTVRRSAAWTNISMLGSELPSLYGHQVTISVNFSFVDASSPSWQWYTFNATAYLYFPENNSITKLAYDSSETMLSDLHLSLYSSVRPENVLPQETFTLTITINATTGFLHQDAYSNKHLRLCINHSTSVKHGGLWQTTLCTGCTAAPCARCARNIDIATDNITWTNFTINYNNALALLPFTLFTNFSVVSQSTERIALLATPMIYFPDTGRYVDLSPDAVIGRRIFVNVFGANHLQISWPYHDVVPSEEIKTITVSVHIPNVPSPLQFWSPKVLCRSHSVGLDVVVSRPVDVYYHYRGDSLPIVTSHNVTELINGIVLTQRLHQGDSVELRVPVRVTNEMSYNDVMEFTAKFVFTDELDDLHHVTATHSVHTRHLSMPSEAATVNIPSSWHTYSPITFSVPISLAGPGLVHVGVDLVYESAGVDLFTMSIEHSSVVEGLMFTPNRRHKRSLTSNTTYGYFQLPPGQTIGTATIVVHLVPVGGTSSAVNVQPTITIGSVSYPLTAFTVPPVPAPLLTISKSVQVLNDTLPQQVRFTVSLSHSPTSTQDAYDVTLSDELNGFTLNQTSVSPPLSAALNYQSNIPRQLTWNIGTLTVGAVINLSYRAGPTDSSTDTFANGMTDFLSNAVYSSNTTTNKTYVLVSTYVCLQRVEVIYNSRTYAYNGMYRSYVQPGYIVLLTLIGLLVGVGIGILIVYLTNRWRRSRGSVVPRELKEVDEDVLDSILLNQYDIAKRTHLKATEKRTKEESSLIATLAMEQKVKQYRKLDSLDIGDAGVFDDDISNENYNDRILTSTLLVNSLVKNGDIDESTRQKTASTFKKNLKEVDNSLEQNYKRELDGILLSVVAKNKREFGELVGVQQQEKKNLKENMKGLPTKEMGEMRKLLEEKHTMEQQELGHRLSLEQEEQMESLRKDFSVRRRLATKDLQLRYLETVIEEGKLDPEKADWLIKKHEEQQKKLEDVHDVEVINQRMMLEEKLQKRKNLARKVDRQEEDGIEMLSSIEQFNMKLLDTAKKLKVVNKYEVKVMAAALVDEMTVIKFKFDETRIVQERYLHTQLTARKKTLLADKRKLQAEDLARFETKMATPEVEGHLIDPMTFVQTQHEILLNHRAELLELESAEDEDHTKQLMRLRRDFILDMRNELERMTDEVVKKLETEGMTHNEVAKLIKQHRIDLDRLLEDQDEDKQMQAEAFRRTLARNRKRWAERREEEKLDQQKLRLHVENVVRNIMMNQMSMSDEERQNLLREYEQQMVKMENSLCLCKLRQMRKLEERISQQKHQQMQILEKKQLLENKKMRRRHKDDADDMDAAEIASEQLDMMRKHVNQKIGILNGDSVKLGDDLLQIEIEMAQERADDIKQQEEKIATMAAAHQLEKAKEIAKIKEHQIAIENLKNNLLNDLNSRNLLSDTECERIIVRHQEDKERLNKKQALELSKQEKILHHQLSERRKQMESKLVAEQELELQRVMGSSSTEAAARFNTVLMLNKQLMEREQFKNRMEKELEQTIEDIGRQNAVILQRTVQNLELYFIAGLIRLGKIQKAEVLKLVRDLSPLKSEAELAEMYQQIADQDKVDVPEKR